MLHVLAAFLSGVAGDVLAVLDFHFTSKNNAFGSATVSAVISAAVLFVFVDITQDPLLAIPYLIGVWLGGYTGIKLKQRLEK